MGDEAEPPDDRSHQEKISNLVSKVYDPRRFFSANGKWLKDEREIFLKKEHENEIGKLNMTYARLDEAALLAYRVREKIDGQETSDIAVNGKRVLSKNDRREYDKISREDPRIAIIDGVPIISCVGYNGYNAVSFAISIDKNYHGTRIGTTGPNIALEEAIGLVPKKSPYKKVLEKELEDTTKRRNALGETGTILPYNKDTSIFKPKNVIEYLRIGNSIQKAETKNISDLKKKQFWRDWFSNIDKHTILNPSDLDKWASWRIGQGSIPKMVIDRKGKERWITVIHGVEDIENETAKELIYRTTFAEYNPETWNMKSCMKYPFLEPGKQDVLEEIDDLGKKWIKSICFGNDLVLPENAKTKPRKGLERELIIIMGVADDKGGYYKTNLEYVLKKLEEPENQIAA